MIESQLTLIELAEAWSHACYLAAAFPPDVVWNRNSTTSPSGFTRRQPSVHVTEELDEQFLDGCGLVHHHHVVRIIDDLDPCIR